MMELARDFDEFFGSLIARGVEFLIVGAYALAFHGVPRFTGDIHILIRPTLDNARSLLEALTDFGFPGHGLHRSAHAGPADGRRTDADPRHEHGLRCHLGGGVGRTGSRTLRDPGVAVHRAARVHSQQAGGGATEGPGRSRGAGGTRAVAAGMTCASSVLRDSAVRAHPPCSAQPRGVAR